MFPIPLIGFFRVLIINLNEWKNGGTSSTVDKLRNRVSSLINNFIDPNSNFFLDILKVLGDVIKILIIVNFGSLLKNIQILLLVCVFV